jgi:NADH:ubiquinone oxidoreductase subunit 4 (subunit M)
MHGRLADNAESREISLRDGAVLVPLVACIVALALYPGLILSRGQAAVEDKVAAVTQNPQPAPGPSSTRAESGRTGQGPRGDG